MSIQARALLVLAFLLCALGVMALYQRLRFFDGKLRVVFCDVGQGDAIFIRTPKGQDILIDAGPDESVLSCLSNHMPFWDRTIELAFLTHPHADHHNGLIHVLNRYRLKYFVTENLLNDTAGFTALLTTLRKKTIQPRFVTRGNSVALDSGVSIVVLGPTKEFLASRAPNGFINEQKEFASLVLYISYGSFDVLTTGDSQVAGLMDASVLNLRGIDVFQVPHHGSKSGITRELMSGLLPKVAVISVGRNSYGHPSKEALEILRDLTIKTLRTDERGTINLVSP